MPSASSSSIAASDLQQTKRGKGTEKALLSLAWRRTQQAKPRFGWRLGGGESGCAAASRALARPLARPPVLRATCASSAAHSPLCSSQVEATRCANRWPNVWARRWSCKPLRLARGRRSGRRRLVCARQTRRRETKKCQRLSADTCCAGRIRRARSLAGQPKGRRLALASSTSVANFIALLSSSIWPRFCVRFPSGVGWQRGSPRDCRMSLATWSTPAFFALSR